MGYYSTMEPIEFKTDYSAEEVKAKFQAFKDNHPNNTPWLDIYDFDSQYVLFNVSDSSICISASFVFAPSLPSILRDSKSRNRLTSSFLSRTPAQPVPHVVDKRWG